MLGLLAFFSVGIYLLAFYGQIQVSEPITIQRLIIVFFIATTINQATYTVTPQAHDVRNLKAIRTAALIEQAPPKAVEVAVNELKAEK
jgi:hypothetical protein